MASRYSKSITVTFPDYTTRSTELTWISYDNETSPLLYEVVYSSLCKIPLRSKPNRAVGSCESQDTIFDSLRHKINHMRLYDHHISSMDISSSFDDNRGIIGSHNSRIHSLWSGPIERMLITHKGRAIARAARLKDVWDVIEEGDMLQLIYLLGDIDSERDVVDNSSAIAASYEERIRYDAAEAMESDQFVEKEKQPKIRGQIDSICVMKSSTINASNAFDQDTEADKFLNDAPEQPIVKPNAANQTKNTVTSTARAISGNISLLNWIDNGYTGYIQSTCPSNYDTDVSTSCHPTIHFKVNDNALIVSLACLLNWESHPTSTRDAGDMIRELGSLVTAHSFGLRQWCEEVSLLWSDCVILVLIKAKYRHDSHRNNAI